MANPEHLAILNQGVEIWNKWRKENPDIEPDLQNVNFKGKDFSEANFEEANFYKSNFSEAILNNSNFTESYFEEANFEKANLGESSIFAAGFFQKEYTDIFDYPPSYSCIQDSINTNIQIINFYGINFSKVDLAGTNFEQTIIHDANFSYASFKRVNFQKAILSAVNINKADFHDANLFKANFSKVDLSQLYTQGIDLSQTQLIEVNLRNKNLEESNLSEADLSKANLSHTNLRRVQAIGTNFCDAFLTGACIEDWHINSKTNLNDVICDYIYLKQNQQERRPHNLDKIFALGEFSKLFKQVVETVDLVFSDGINWQAFLHSFQKLQIECDSEELAIQAIEKKSGGAFVIRVEVPSDANKAEIEKYIENEYQIKLQSIEEKYKFHLGMKDEQISICRQDNTDLKEIIKLQASQPINSNHFMSSINQYHSGDGDNIGRDKNINNVNESPEAIQIIQDLQSLLEKTSQGHDLNNTGEKLAVATEAFETIKQDNSLSKKVLSALEKGGAAWLQAKLINPSASFLVAALEDWQKNKQ